jgi:hypothetical protein
MLPILSERLQVDPQHDEHQHIKQNPHPQGQNNHFHLSLSIFPAAKVRKYCELFGELSFYSYLFGDIRNSNPQNVYLCESLSKL